MEVFFILKPVSRQEEVTASLNAKTVLQDFKEHEKEGSMTPPKEHNDFPFLKEMEICNLPD